MQISFNKHIERKKLYRLFNEQVEWIEVYF